MKEIYLEVPFAKQYLVSNYGFVKSKRFNRPLKPQINSCGYGRVAIGKNNQRYFVHRLVAITFLGEAKNKIVNHKDGNKLNNSLLNLEWMTYKQNTQHAVETGLRKIAPTAKLTLEQANFIKKELKSDATLNGMKILAKKYDVSLWAIKDIKLKRTWI
jgi:hypothetical protein